MADKVVNKTLEVKSLPNMIKFLANSYQTGKEYETKKFRKKWLDSAKGFYSKDLSAHYGCLNAVEFSDEGEELLFSGGDDRRVLLWKVEDAVLGRAKPSVMEKTHYSNIFCLAVDSNNQRVFSGSNDDQVIMHDYITGRPFDFYLHESPVFCISLQPNNMNVFTSASENGRVLLFDTRQPPTAEALCVARRSSSFYGVMFHPIDTVLLATAHSRSGVDIWDIRQPNKSVQDCCDNHAMTVRWNNYGTSLLCIRAKLPPLLINPRKPCERVEFEADTYYNSCTTKSCCFAGENDEYIVSGSDDFNIYIWKIPQPWPTSQWVPKQHLTLRGHRSIVNQVRYSTRRQLIASTGVEKVIKLWSPFEMPESRGGRDEVTETRGRLMCSSAEMCNRSQLPTNGESEDVYEDKTMLHYFDTLLRDEFKLTVNEFSSALEKYNVMIKRKRLLLWRSLHEPEPFVCSLRISDDSPSGGRRRLILSPTSSTSTILLANSSSLSPPSGILFPYSDSESSSEATSSTAPSPSQSSSSSSSTEEEASEILQVNNRKYRMRRRSRHDSDD